MQEGKSRDLLDHFSGIEERGDGVLFQIGVGGNTWLDVMAHGSFVGKTAIFGSKSPFR